MANNCSTHHHVLRSTLFFAILLLSNAVKADIVFSATGIGGFPIVSGNKNAVFVVDG